ncbi:MAG: ATP-binding protein [Bacteroidota bacterium]
MKRLLFLLLILLLNCAPLFAQDNLPSAYAIHADTAESLILDDHYVQIAGDQQGTWTIEQLTQSPVAGNFRRIDSLPATESNYNVYWVRYRLKNQMNHPAKIALDAYGEENDFFVFDEAGNSSHYFTGSLVAWQKKDGLKFNNYIPIIIEPAGEVTIYNRVHNRAPGVRKEFQVDIGITEKIIQRDYVQHVETGSAIFKAGELGDSFLVGILFISLLFNLFFFFVVKEKEYLYYSLLLSGLAADRLINIVSITALYSNPIIEERIGYFNLSWGIMLFALVQFVSYFLNVKERFPRFNKILFWTGLTALVYNTVCHFVDPDYLLDYPWPKYPLMGFIFGIFVLVICFSVLAIFGMYLREKKSFTKLLIFGGSPLILIWGIILPWSTTCTFLSKQYGMPTPSSLINFPYRVLETLFTASLVLLFSGILFIRFNALKKENAQQALDKERLEKEKQIERNQLIEQQKVELIKTVNERTADLKKSLEELKSTQALLIQSEKMASLGELTAGIAHEIQNPLNFVNNFSEVSNELIQELKSEKLKVKPERDEQLEDELLNDISQNLEKINHHGKRADAIVKGMLQHSQLSGGVKESTNINALADEYLRLAYHACLSGRHGLKGTDNSFNVTMKTDFDETIENINIIPQDIGRVLLNLYNNAFYAVNEKKKQTSIELPTISVSTRKNDGKILVSVKDNGNGIPQKIVDKIFQPFFTTKPTGQGTGLGLSLAYDIVKAHGGEINVKTRENEGSEFIIQLPID